MCCASPLRVVRSCCLFSPRQANEGSQSMANSRPNSCPCPTTRTYKQWLEGQTRGVRERALVIFRQAQAVHCGGGRALSGLPGGFGSLVCRGGLLLL